MKFFGLLGSGAGQTSTKETKRGGVEREKVSVGDDDAADALRCLIAAKARKVRQRKLTGVRD